MDVCRECCVLSGRGLFDVLITHPEESYRLWCVVVCNLETSRIRKPWPWWTAGSRGGGGIALLFVDISMLWSAVLMVAMWPRAMEEWQIPFWNRGVHTIYTYPTLFSTFRCHLPNVAIYFARYLPRRKYRCGLSVSAHSTLTLLFNTSIFKIWHCNVRVSFF